LRILRQNAGSAPIPKALGCAGVDVVAVAVAGFGFPQDDPDQVIGAAPVILLLHFRADLVIGLGDNRSQRAARRVITPRLKRKYFSHHGGGESDFSKAQAGNWRGGAGSTKSKTGRKGIVQKCKANAFKPETKLPDSAYARWILVHNRRRVNMAKMVQFAILWCREKSDTNQFWERNPAGPERENSVFLLSTPESGCRTTRLKPKEGLNGAPPKAATAKAAAQMHLTDPKSAR